MGLGAAPLEAPSGSLAIDLLAAVDAKSERIHDVEKRKAVEVHVSCANATYSMLAHEDGGVGVVQQVTGEPREFRDHLLGNVAMALGRYKHAKSG